MLKQEHQISYGEEEATFPDTEREESLRWFSHGTELAVCRSLYPQPHTTVPFPPEFDPSSQIGCISENSSMFRYHLQNLDPLASSDGPMPLLSSSLRSDISTSSDSLPSIVPSDLKQPPWRPELLFGSQEHELQLQIDQVVDPWSFHPVPEADINMEMELPSNQSHHDINGLLTADQQMTINQIVGMNHLSSFQLDAAGNPTVIAISESTQISRSNCGAFVINGSQGENTDCSTDGVLSNHPTGKRIRTFEEDITKPSDCCELSFPCLPAVCSSALPLQTMPIQQVSEISVAKKQKFEIGWRGTSATPPKPLFFYNFMKLPHDVYVAERDAIAKRCSDDDDVDVELKL